MIETAHQTLPAATRTVARAHVRIWESKRRRWSTAHVDLPEQGIIDAARMAIQTAAGGSLPMASIQVDRVEMFPAWQDGLPDVDTTVLVRIEGGDDPVWIGFHDGQAWRDVVGTRFKHSERITGWMPFPAP